MNCRGVLAYIGVGSNLDEPLRQCRQAMIEIAAARETRLLRISSYYRTEPVGVSDQGDFINAVAEIRTILPPRELLQALQAIEKQMGRRETFRWGPRIIDLDIILYGMEIITEEGLVIPHPECHRRKFVLVPCCELGSYMIHPVFGVSIQGLLQRVEQVDCRRIERIETLPAEENKI